MKPNQTLFASPHLSFFSDDQINEIHLKTLEVLERVGVRVDEPEALELLAGAGAFVTKDKVRIPSWIVDEAIRTSPQRVVLADRGGNRKLFLEKNQPYFGPGSDLPYTIDTYTGERRRSVKRDVVNASKVVEALENIDFMMSMGIACDVPEATSDLHQFDAMVTNTTVPIVFTAHHRQGLLDIIEMASIVAGGLDKLKQNPFIACYNEPISPLMHSPEGTHKLLTCAENGIPIVYTPGLMAGATGPVTMAGAVITANAELLSGLVIHQLKKRGAPFIYGGVATIMDMKTSILPYAAPEWHMNSLVITQLAQFYKLPVFSTGGCSDSPIFDNQASIEATYSLLLAGLSGANLIHDVGYIESGLTQSLASLTVCNETISLVRRIIRGYQINDETVAIDVIEEVGPGGEFVTHEHTLKHFRQEHWSPKLINRYRYDEWKEKGGTTMAQRANEEVKKILESDNENQLDKETSAYLSEYLKVKDRVYS
ncbi:MAG: trimethylamine methyltransferase [Desulfitibacter sp. BRH_c19]|nr:MAG: trimethylamine methyltransferase [Desulfitibacter sp. BRH_c19]